MYSFTHKNNFVLIQIGLGDLNVFSFSKNTWSSLTPLPGGSTTFMASSALDPNTREFIIFGGYGPSSLFIYNSTSKQLRVGISNMNYIDQACVVSDNYTNAIYVYGGRNGNFGMNF